MSFWGKKFIFDDIPSDTYNLLCGNFDESSSGYQTSSAGSSVEILEEYLTKRSKPYFYGTKFSSKLEFKLVIFSESEINRIKLQSIEGWLFGRKEYKKLQILQCDMYDVYFNCIITEGNIVEIGNLVYGIECTVICDSPWGWGRGIKKTYVCSSAETSIGFTNTSDDSLYLYPKIYLKSGANQANVKIKNITDNNREVIFSQLYLNEIITIDCDLKIVESNNSTILTRFNGKYFRLLQGYNNLYVTGNLSIFSIEYSPARKVGA